MVFPSSHELGSFRGCKFLPPISDALSIDRILGLVTAEGESIPAGLFSLECLPRVVARCFSYRYGPRVQSQIFCSDSIKSRSEKYLLWKARTFWSKHVWSFLILIFSFLSRPFYPGTYRKFFITPLLISQTQFFYFCNTCLLRTSDVAGRNIFYYLVVWLQSPFATLTSFQNSLDIRFRTQNQEHHIVFQL